MASTHSAEAEAILDALTKMNPDELFKVHEIDPETQKRICAEMLARLEYLMPNGKEER